MRVGQRRKQRGEFNPEGGGPAAWCDKKVATTPRWGIRTRSDAALWHRNKHDLGGCWIEVVEEVSAEKRCETFSCFFLLPWDLRKGGSGGQRCLFACSLVGAAGIAGTAVRRRGPF